MSLTPKMAFRPCRKAQENAAPEAGLAGLTNVKSSDPPAKWTRPPMKAKAEMGRKTDLTVKMCLAALGLTLVSGLASLWAGNGD